MEAVVPKPLSGGSSAGRSRQLGPAPPPRPPSPLPTAHMVAHLSCRWGPCWESALSGLPPRDRCGFSQSPRLCGRPSLWLLLSGCRALAGQLELRAAWFFVVRRSCFDTKGRPCQGGFSPSLLAEGQAAVLDPSKR